MLTYQTRDCFKEMLAYQTRHLFQRNVKLQNKGIVSSKDFILNKGIVSNKDYILNKGIVSNKDYILNKGIVSNWWIFESQSAVPNRQNASLLYDACQWKSGISLEACLSQPLLENKRKISKVWSTFTSIEILVH